MKKLLILLSFVSIFALSNAQYSTLDQFRSHKGTNTLIRTDYSRTYFVTYYKNASDRKCIFIVQHVDTTRYINLLQAIENGLPNPVYGYEIKDMRIIGQECYFCGCKWVETGNIIYNLDGTMSFERVYKGIIGRFDVRDAIHTGGNYEIMEIDTTKCLYKIALLSGRVLATGTLYDGYTSCLVALKEVNYANYSPDYNYRVMTSQIPGEYFFDVTATYDKFVAVSRYGNINNQNQYKYYFGLRYGTGFDYYGSTSGVYDYNVQNVIANEGASFVSMEPMLITSHQMSDEVVVAYLNRKLSNRKDMPIFYKIPSEGLNISKALIAIGTYCEYQSLKEIQYNRPMVSTSRMVALLEDFYGNSILRFPDWNISNNSNDTILFTNLYELESIAPHQYISSSLELRTAGYDPNNDNKVVQLFTNDIHGYQGKWATHSCIQYQQNTIEEVQNINVSGSLNEISLNDYYYRDHRLFTSVEFTPRNVAVTRLCTNY